MIVGLTGGYCAGKNAVASILEEQGWTCIDVDRLGHRALEESAQAVAALLGPAILDGSGRPDRRKIGAMVFSDPGLLLRYEAIVHPAMLRLLDAALAAAGPDGSVCINAAILYRLPQARLCGRILEVRAPLALRLRRARERDGLSPLRALQRIVRQNSLRKAGKWFASLIRVIRNDGGLSELRTRARDALASD